MVLSAKLTCQGGYMGGINWAQADRAELADLFRELGPDQPTLCGDWTTHDLAAHLVMREARPDGAAGIAIPAFSGQTDRLQKKYEQRDYNDLVEAVAAGPPKLSTFSLPGADSMLNTTEYFVHLEDVRRAQPEWEPRDLPQEYRDTLWSTVKRRGSVMMRKSPVGIELVRTDASGHPRATVVKKPNTVTISGDAGELLLYQFGRKNHARVTLDGDPDAIAKVQAANFSV